MVSLIRGQDPVRRQTGEARVPYGGEFPDVKDIDDLKKVRRLLGYIRKTRTAGVYFRIGSDLIIRVYVDTAYGVHIHDGK